MPEVSSELLALSVRQIVTHPLQYVRNVAIGSVRFGKGLGRIYLSRSGPGGVLRVIWTAEQLILFVVVGLAFLAALAAVTSRFRSVMRAPRGRAWVFLAAVVVLSCLFQAMSIYAENARYGVPFQPVFGLCVVVFFWEAQGAWRRRHGRETQASEVLPYPACGVDLVYTFRGASRRAQACLGRMVARLRLVRPTVICRRGPAEFAALRRCDHVHVGIGGAVEVARFVYMTGHTDGTGLDGTLHLRNQEIRNYCKANDKVLYDFEDIESYDPDGRYLG